MTVLDEVPIQRVCPVRAALHALISEPPYLVLAVISAVGLLLLYTVLFLLSTTFEVFFLSNTLIYIVVSIALTGLISVIGGITMTQSIFVFTKQIQLRRGQGTARGVAGTVIGALASGCPSCASILLPAFGIAGSLAAFPLAGLEIKLLSVLLLGEVLWENSRVMAGVCSPIETKLVRVEDGEMVIDLSFQALRTLKPVLLITIVVLVVYLLPLIPSQYRVSFASKYAPNVVQAQGQQVSSEAAQLIAQINPAEGYTVNARYGDIGPQLIASGAIDLERFTQVYEQAKNPLSSEELAILTKGSDAKIIIKRQNAHFLLNLFWALGLANKNAILEEGPLKQNSQGDITGYASTGGWSLSTKPVPEVYSSTPILTLTPAQQKLVEEAASNTYRPCCNNSTLFADCNHGMAMLGLFELMASQGASLDEMYNAAKYFNAFWFPQQTFDLAVYFKAQTGQNFADVDGKTIVSGQMSSGRGWSAVKQWLSENGKSQEIPGGGGCGV